LITRWSNQPAKGAFAQRRPGTLLSASVARASAWLVEPDAPRAAPEPSAPPARVAVAVCGLAPRCGVTTVARGLAAELARRDPSGAAAVTGSASAALPLALPSSVRLARALASALDVAAKPLGRLAVVGAAEPSAFAYCASELAPVVLDVPAGEAPGVAAAAAHMVVLVAPAAAEPALAEMAAAGLARTGPEPVLVVNRGPAGERWAGRAALTMPESRAGARLALAGREPGRGLGAAVAELADLCDGLAKQNR
jgi:hypothetical protein